MGRRAELDALAEAWEQASGGRSRIVCVEGPPGIGKTALVRAFLAAAAPLLVCASGDEAETTLPWGVVSQLVRSAPAGRSGPMQRLAELRPSADPLASGRLLLDALGALASGGPVVLVVEDLHWIDHPSAQALRFALRRLGEERVLAVVTTRPEGPVQFDDGWRRLLDDRGERLRLAGLGPPEVAELVFALGGGRLSGPADTPAVAPRRREPALYPLFDRGTRSGSTGGSGRAAASSAVTGGVAGGPPGGLRAGKPGPDLGSRGAGGALLARHGGVVGWCAAPAEALGEALAARLLTENNDEGVRQVRFPHPLVRAALYSDLSPARRTALHLAAARLTAGADALSHRVAAAAGPDAALAAELAERAGTESAGGLHASAARHLISAADLSAEPALREDRLLAACTLWLRRRGP